MSKVEIVHNPSQQVLDKLGVKNWPIWEKEISEFPWTYDDKETCYLLAGEVEVTDDSGNVATFGAGDLVVFPSGMSCTWKIKNGVRKHYNFG